MRNQFLLLCTLFFISLSCESEVDLSQWQDRADSDFKKSQWQYPRVREAYQEKRNEVQNRLVQIGTYSFEIDLYLRAFKQEEELEVWVKNRQEKKYKHFITYPFCNTSGTLGPKRIQGDGQIPEGFYKINYYNPHSQFLLSLKANYPNAADKILSDAQHPGGDIYLHGGCATIGCIPITNPKIQELYILAIEAFRPGKAVPIHFFPFRLSDPLLAINIENFPSLQSFWQELKIGYDYFEKHRQVPLFQVEDTGVYTLLD